MALLPSIRIDIASGFNDKGFKKASRSATLLTRQFKQLGGTVAAALSIQAVARYARASVKAFSEEDAAVTKLTKTFKNLGLSFQAAAANDFISVLQRQVAVSDDELRPALETLVRTTLDLEKAQKILGVALDVSAGTGYDLQKVTSALSKAYLGQGSALGKLNIGIGQVESKTISFNDALGRLQDRFGGQAAAAVDTYAGKLKLLSIASEEAKESIGQRLLLALELLSKDQTIEGLTNDMEDFADKIGLASVGLGSILGQLNRKVSFGGRTLGEILFAAAGGGFIDALAKKGAQVEYGVKQRTLGAPGAMQQQAKEAAIRKKALEDQKKTIALQKKAAADAAKREREAQQLKRAGTVFDMEAIQIIAALQNRVSEENRLRLTALLAIQSDNADAADKLTQAVLMLQKPALENLGITLKTGDTAVEVISKIINAQTKLFLLNTGIANLPKAKNPFEDWDSILDRLLSKIGQIKTAISGFGSQNGNGSGPTAGGGGDGGGAGVGDGGGAGVGAGGGAGGGAGVGAGGGAGVGAGGAGGGGFGAGGGGFGAGGGGFGSPIITDPNSVNIIMDNGEVANPFNTFTVNGATIIANSGVVLTGQADDTQSEATARQRVADIFSTIGTFGAGGFNPTNVTVNVAGNVMSNDDLLQVITEGLYEVQKRGQNITLNAVAI